LLQVRSGFPLQKHLRNPLPKGWQSSTMKTLHLTAQRTKLAMLTLLLALSIVPSLLYSQQTTASPVKTLSAPEEQPDPNKPASERNHHLSGYALIAIGALVIAGQSSQRLRALQLVWPFLFVAAGLFLALWSDGEMWPRGDLNWIWLIHHDAEARQHKVYAILLMVMGVIEYLRVKGKLSRFWRVAGFPLLALFGAVLLLFHDHTAASGADTPEARKYVVSWLANRTSEAAAGAHTDPKDTPTAGHHHDMASMANMTSDTSAVETQRPQSVAAGHQGMEMDDGSHGHHHHMTAAMLKVQQQHLWFALIGVACVLFKFLYDSGVWRRSFVPFLWPSCISLLGMLLVLYTE